MWNEYQSTEEQLHIESLPDEVQEQFYKALSIPFVKWLISKDRPRAKDLPRDERGRIIVDITKPHILEDMDYFRPTAIHYQKTGRLTDLRPNSNPRSAFGQWFMNEWIRCLEGYVRESDGEWVTGDMYYFLNYCPIEQSKIVVGSSKASRIVDFPEVWDGIYLRYHYMEQAAQGGIFDPRGGLNGCEISSRGKSKSLTMAAKLSKFFTLGESKEVNQKVKAVAAAYTKEYLNGNDGILTKVQNFLDFAAKDTQFPHLMLRNSLQDMQWQLGWKDLNTGARMGTLNQLSGIAIKDDVGKIRGKRQNFIVCEEFGSFPGITSLYNIMLPCVREGDYSFGQMYLVGCCCAGTKVWTNNGELKNIEDLTIEDGIIGYGTGPFISDPVTGFAKGVCKQPIGSKINLGTKPCYRITLSNGNYIECSNDHPILTCNMHKPRRRDDYNHRRLYHTLDFINAENIKIGTKVCEARTINTFGQDTLFDPRLVGMLIGDGTYGYYNTPVYSSEDAELLNYIKDKYDWSLSTSHITKKNKIYEEIRVKNICKNLREIGIYGQTKTNKRLPTKYQSLTREDTALLLSGLVDTDGSVCKTGKDWYITITQSTSEILEQIKLLFRKFGIIGTICKYEPKLGRGRKDKNPWYTLSISGRYNMLHAAECLKLLVPHKAERLNTAVKWYNEHPSKKEKKYPEDIICYRVTNIEYLGEREIYNLSALASHTYLANNIITHNTAGDKESDFQQATELVYNPRGYYMYPLPNVYDYPGEGRSEITFFYPEYLNRKGYYDQNGNSDVTGALIALLLDRYHVKYNTTDLGTITKSICERPITPQEAIMRSSGNKFPINDLNQRLNELDNDTRAYDDVYVGDLVESASGEVEFVTNSDIPIRKYPIDNNMTAGALEIYALPAKNKEGKIPYGRYICATDPIDQDSTTDSSSLYSTFVLDLFTDNIVAEYTGRKQYSEECYEVTRKLCKFYNCQCLYENNVKGLFAYFSKIGCLNLLADTPEYLQDKQLTKISSIGNNAKGVRATAPINNYADELIREWLIQPEVCIIKDAEGKEIEATRRHLFSLRNRALIQELICYNPYVNVDRVRALGMLMLFREQHMISNHGKITAENTERRDTISEDPFFEKNFNVMYTWG